MPDRNVPKEVELLILGGGITGCTLFSVASCSGRKTLLIDKNDFASGSSQSSGMMIWGGLLYMKNFELLLVRQYCKSRDWLIRKCPEVDVRNFNYLLLRKGGRSGLLIKSALLLYWLLSSFTRRCIRAFPLDRLPKTWNRARFKSGIRYEEAFLKQSDAQYSYDWLRQNDTNNKALNYCSASSISWQESEGFFLVELTDHVSGQTSQLRAQKIINCCGVWVDGVNQQFAVHTTNCHHLSKGVYLLLDRQHAPDEALVVDMEQHGDTLCWVPWGDVVMWGPTETDLNDLGDISVRAEDCQFLLEKLNQNTTKAWTESDILNVRVGVRPLPKQRGQHVAYSLDLSRKAIIESSGFFPWWSIFGGKLSGGYTLSRKIYKKVFKERARPFSNWAHAAPIYTTRFFNGREVKCPSWSQANEQVVYLEDYLRRRTNIAQWIPRSGFGKHGEFASDLFQIALLIHPTQSKAIEDYQRYQQKVLEKEKLWKSPQFWEALPPFSALKQSLNAVSHGPFSAEKRASE